MAWARFDLLMPLERRCSRRFRIQLGTDPRRIRPCISSRNSTDAKRQVGRHPTSSIRRSSAKDEQPTGVRPNQWPWLGFIAPLTWP